MLPNRSFGGNFAGAEPSVQLDKTVALGLRGILCDGVFNHFIVCEQIKERSVRAETQRAEQDGCANLSLSVDVNPQNALRVLLEFKPRAAVWDNGSSENFLTGLVPRGSVVGTGRADELGDDNALGAVDYKRTRIGHKRELAHKYGLVDNLFLYLVDEPNLDVHGKRVSSVAVATLLFVVLRLFVKPVFEEIKLVMVGVVGNGHKVFKDFRDALLHKRVIA